MNIRDLIIFQTVANLGSINKAAKHLNYVQSNVTSRIQKIEEELNTKLFHRHKRGITLTNEGDALIPYVQKVISLTEEMKLIGSDKDNPSGKLDIASVETVIKLPIILSTFIEKYKRVDLTLSTGVTADLIEKVVKYNIDGAFVTKSALTNDARLEEIDVFNENLVIISYTDNINLEELDEHSI